MYCTEFYCIVLLHDTHCFDLAIDTLFLIVFSFGACFECVFCAEHVECLIYFEMLC
jgi:hypothetical protein